ncbi:hypothetical protein [Rummeliibacillus sp. POC4]|uniref:hypothetical protein n=1 Tax=Rummeliibacillus sp. POC4 TaxID=2305899 RepID=UPI000E665B33|nr:hypothetical protein [Rummeliibacillus sp. POC4]RIJ63624.1 hypothetical protein D1606_14180 [Rummeliibacillus sp. POC4]
MAWGRFNGKKLVRGFSKKDVEKKMQGYLERGWKPASKIQTECKNGGAYAILMEFPNKKHA